MKRNAKLRGDPSPVLQVVSQEGSEKLQERLSREVLVNEGTNLARALASLPPNILDPGSYTILLQSLAKAKDWEYTEWTSSELAVEGCGAFCAVTQANSSPSDRLVRLRWRPGGGHGTSTHDQ